MAANSSSKESPSFVFKGTIQEVNSATMKQVPVDKRTVVVMVDQVIEAPKNLARLGGHRITVRLSGSGKAQPGQQFIFYAHGWIFGDSVAVQSVKQEPIKQTKAHGMLLGQAGDPVMRKQNREAEKRFDSADVVVSGKVTAVRLPSESAPAAKSKSTRAGKSKSATVARPVSEHSPHWREAVVEIDDVHKGEHGKRTVVVRFPSSTDVRWYKAPKFQPGQQGTFMLRKTELAPGAKPAKKGKAKAKAGMAQAVEAYTALDPMDFQPYDQPGGVKKMIDEPEKQKPPQELNEKLLEKLLHH